MKILKPSTRPFRVCMVAYAEYFCDARIKSYVRTIESRGGIVDVLALKENGRSPHECIGNCRMFYLTRKYQGARRLHYVWSYSVYFITCFLRLTLLTLKERYLAVHVHNMPNFIVFAAVVPRLLGAKIVLDIHDLMSANYMTKFDRGMNPLIAKCLIFEQRLSALFASHVLCADHNQKAYLKGVCRIPERKMTVIMNLPNEQIFRHLNKKKQNENFELIYHGTISRRLGIDIMLDAISKIGDQIPVHLSIYGSGDFLGEATSYSQKLGLHKRVYFSKSFFPTEKVPEMVRSMDLGIVANRKSVATDRFMMPVKLLEYVYLGIPVVAPRLQIIMRYFDEKMIKYYEPENSEDLARCIIELYGSPEQRASLVTNALKFYEKRSWRAQAEEYLKILSTSMRG